MTEERKRPLPWWGIGMDFVAGAVVFVLLWQLIRVRVTSSLSIGSYVAPPPTPGDIANYWVLAGVIFAILVFGFVVAVLQLRGAAMFAYPVVGILSLVIVLVFAVPSLDWGGSDPTYPPNPNACYRTDSENCPGG